MNALLEKGTSTSLCIAFVILTGLRVSEARLARWSEIDLEGLMFVVPKARMKGKKHLRREHQVPLSDAAVDLLRRRKAASLRM